MTSNDGDSRLLSESLVPRFLALVWLVVPLRFCVLTPLVSIFFFLLYPPRKRTGVDNAVPWNTDHQCHKGIGVLGPRVATERGAVTVTGARHAISFSRPRVRGINRYPFPVCPRLFPERFVVLSPFVSRVRKQRVLGWQATVCHRFMSRGMPSSHTSDLERVAAPLAVGHITVVLASAFVGLRFVSRGYILRVLGPPDWVIAFSLVRIVSPLSLMMADDYGSGALDCLYSCYGCQ